MVIGLLAIASIPTIIGTGQAVSAQKKQNAAAQDQAEFLLAAMIGDEEDDEEYPVVLVDGRLWVDHPACPFPGHRFSGHYFTYPGEEGHRGLVSTIQDDPPMLNWIYVDADTRAFRYAGRKDTIGHVIGPWGWTEDERLLTLRESPDGFAMVREGDGKEQRWAIYWDPDGELQRRKKSNECVTVALRRRMRLGMESKYVKGPKGEKSK